jgi:cation/acetate symporter
MVAGLGVTLFYMVGSRFFDLSWFDTDTVASGVFGIPLGFLTIYVVSLLTPAPSQEVQDLVVAVRYPKTGGASVAVTALR